MCSESVLVNLGCGKARAVTLRCRSWSCPLCYDWRRKQLIAEAVSGRPNILVTLTVNPAWGFSPVYRARALSRAWAAIARRAKRKYGYKCIPYFAVFEATKAGEPHLHILVRVKWIDQRWLSRQMAKLMAAPIVDVRPIRNPRQAAGYVAKYIGKNPHRFETCKRYWSTRDWDLSDWEEPEREAGWSNIWEAREVDFRFLTEMWENLGMVVYREGRMLCGSRDPPESVGSW